MTEAQIKNLVEQVSEAQEKLEAVVASATRAASIASKLAKRLAKAIKESAS